MKSVREKIQINLKDEIGHKAYTELIKHCIDRYKIWDAVCFAFIGTEDAFEENHLFLLDVKDEIDTEIKNMIKS